MLSFLLDHPNVLLTIAIIGIAVLGWLTVTSRP